MPSMDLSLLVFLSHPHSPKKKIPFFLQERKDRGFVESIYQLLTENTGKTLEESMQALSWELFPSYDPRVLRASTEILLSLYFDFSNPVSEKQNIDLYNIRKMFFSFINNYYSGYAANEEERKKILEHFLKQHGHTLNLPTTSLTPETLEQLIFFDHEYFNVLKKRDNVRFNPSYAIHIFNKQVLNACFRNATQITLTLEEQKLSGRLIRKVYYIASRNQVYLDFEYKKPDLKIIIFVSDPMEFKSVKRGKKVQNIVWIFLHEIKRNALQLKHITIKLKRKKTKYDIFFDNSDLQTFIFPLLQNIDEKYH